MPLTASTAISASLKTQPPTIPPGTFFLLHLYILNWILNLIFMDTELSQYKILNNLPFS